MKVGLNLVNLKSEKNRLPHTAPEIKSSNTLYNTTFGQLSKTQADAIKSMTQIQKSQKMPNGVSGVISFTGNYAKNLNQVVMIAPEIQDNGTLFKDYKVGGYGNVVGEASVAFHDQGGLDFRTIIPYYAADNKGGGIKVKTPLIENDKQVMWSVPDGKGGVKDVPAHTFKEVGLDYVLKEGEDFVVHDAIKEDAPWKTTYAVLEKTSVNGSVKEIDGQIKKMNDIPYQLYKVAGTGADIQGHPPIYVLHTQDLAKFARPYNTGAPTSSGAYGADGFSDLFYQNFSRATNDALPKMNTEEFGNFNPASWWLGDRFDSASLVDAAERSSGGDTYFDGIRAHFSYHNPGRGYQGYFRNPIDFMRLVGSEADLEKLKQHSEYNFVEEMVKKIEDVRSTGEKFDPVDILTKEELEKLDAIFKPVFGDFMDETGHYNLSMVPVAAAKKNPYNYTFGTVSNYYGKEMRNHNTEEIAPGLTRAIAGSHTIDVTNGSTPASLKLDQKGNFGKGGFTTEMVAKSEFTPLTKEVTDDIDKFYSAKQTNKKWMINSIAEATEKGNDELAKLFFDEADIKKGSTVIGGLSKYKDGDMLFISWGRPNDQKGLPTTLESFLQYFKDESVPKETRLKTKALVGAGAWDPSARDWQLIQDKMKEIAELDGGAYKNNVCYANGFFSNRVVACADYSIITSRYEPCGITPLESFCGGTPVLSNKTGGSPDFIVPYNAMKGADNTKAVGFLTDHAFYVNPEVLGKEADLAGDVLDDARIAALGAENAKSIKEAVHVATQEHDTYKQMMKNAFEQKVEWHANHSFNGGKSAIERYTEDAWHITKKGDEYVQIPGLERNSKPLMNLKGDFTEFTGVKQAKNAVEQKLDTIIDKLDGVKEGNGKKIKNFLDNMSLKGQIALIAGVAVVGASAIWAIINRDSAKKAQEKEQAKEPAKYTPSIPVNEAKV